MPSGIYPVNWGTYNIRPVGDPGDPMLDEARTLSALMTAQARAARAMGGGGGGGKEKATSGKMLLNVDGKPEWVDVPGSTGQERMQNAKMMQKAYDEALVQNRTATLTESLADWGNMSNKRKADTLARVKSDVLPSLSQGLDKKQTEALTAALAPYDKSQKEEQRAIKEDMGFGTQLWRRGIDAAANAWDATASLLNDWRGDTAAAEQNLRNIAERQQAAAREPYMREQMLREAEGEGAVERMSGATGSFGATAGSVLGPFVPQAVPILAATAAGGLMAGPPGAAAGGGAMLKRLAAGAAIGAAINTPVGLGMTAERIMGDTSVPEEQRVQAALENALTSAAIHAGIGALPLGVAEVAVGNQLAKRALAPITEAAAERVASGALTSEAASAAVAAASKAATARSARNLAEDIATSYVAQAGLSAADLAAQNYRVGQALGKEIDLTEGMGAALAAAVPFGALSGVARTISRTPRSYRFEPEAVDARAKLGFEPAPTAEADASWRGAVNAFGRQFDESFKKVSADDLAKGLTPELLHPQVQRAMLAERMVRPDLDPNFKVNELDFMRMVRDQSSEGSFWKTEQGGKIFDAYEKYANEHPEILNAGRPQNAAGAEGAGTNGAGTRAATNAGQAEPSAASPDMAGNPPSGDSMGAAAAKRGASPDAAGTQSPDGNTGGNQGARAGGEPVQGAGQAEAGDVNAQASRTPAGEPRADSGAGTSPESTAVPAAGAGERGAVGSGERGASDAQRATNDVRREALKQNSPFAMQKSLEKGFDEMGLTNKGKIHNQLKLQDAIDAVDASIERAQSMKNNARAVKAMGKLRSSLVEQLNDSVRIEGAYYAATQPTADGVHFTPDELRLFDRYGKDVDAVKSYLDDLQNSGSPELEAMANWFRENQNSPWAEKLKSAAFMESLNRAEGLDGVLPDVPPSELAAEVASNRPAC